MPNVKRLISAAAVVAATIAAPTTAAADPICASVGYALLGSGTDVGTCAPWITSTGYVTGDPGDPDLAEIRFYVTYPWPAGH